MSAIDGYGRAREEWIEKILALPYRRVYTRNPGGAYTAVIDEFQGCVAEGESVAEAARRLNDAAAAWIEAVVESGGEIPAPDDLVMCRELRDLLAWREQR